MNRTTTHRQFGPIYCDPTFGNIPGGIFVRMAFTTGYTFKNVLFAFTQQATAMARLACISWVHPFNSDAVSLCFVKNKLLKLVETPTRNQTILMLVPNFCFVANAFQLFHADQSDFVPFSLFHKLFGNQMVFVTNAPPFISRLSFQNASGPSSSFRLQ